MIQCAGNYVDKIFALYESIKMFLGTQERDETPQHGALGCSLHGDYFRVSNRTSPLNLF